MTDKAQRPERRAQALSRERIVEAAIEILDTQGVKGLTFRALATRLATGSGAIYWHIADKDALLAAATDVLIARAVAQDIADASPPAAIRALVLAVFDAIHGHPWLGAQLSGDPSHDAVLRILESIGAQIVAMRVPAPARFNAATALLSFILGLAGQYAVGSRRMAGTIGETIAGTIAGTIAETADRAAFLRAMAARWMQLDPAQHPFLHQVAPQLADHDDREQFLAGIDLILAGIAHIPPA